jgi:hypothetical protein
MLILSDRIKETSTTSGYGSVTLNGPFGGFQSFSNGIGNNNTTYYAIENETRWEVGIGTYSSAGNSLSRDTVFASSNGGNKINLAGVSTVFCTYPASKALYYNENNKVGINTNNPQYQFHVEGSGKFSKIFFPDGTFIDSFSSTSILPDQTSNSGKFLSTNGINPLWTNVDLSSVSGNLHQEIINVSGYFESKVILPIWGNISGILSNQTDLYNELIAISGFSRTYTNTTSGNLHDEILNTSGWNKQYTDLQITALSGMDTASYRVPYTGASGNVNLGNYSITVNKLGFNTNPSGANSVGELIWDNGHGAPSLLLYGGNVQLPLGQKNVSYCYNGTSLQINKGQVVYISGAQGQEPKVNLAIANKEATSSSTFGLAAENISAGSTGYFTTLGELSNVNTSMFTEGAALWLSPSVSGGITETKPQAPDHIVLIGYCIKSNASSGRIFVKIQNGYELDEIHNVKISGVLNEQIIAYNSGIRVWENVNADYIVRATSGNLHNEIINVSGWNKQYTDLQIVEVSGWSKSYTDTTSGNLKSQLDNVSGWNKQYTDIQIVALSGYVNLTSGNLKSYTDTTSGNLVSYINLTSGNLNARINTVSGYFETGKQDKLTAGSGLVLYGTTLNVSIVSGVPSGMLYLNDNSLMTATSNVKFSNSNPTSPKLVFQPSGTITQPVALNILTDASGTTSGVATLSFDGVAGQLFSITDQLATGTIFNVGNITGLPQFRIDASGNIYMVEYGRSVKNYRSFELMPSGITTGTTSPLRFYELAANGSNFVGFKAPDNIASNVTWTLPNIVGTSGYVLSTDGSGNLSWAIGGTIYSAGSGLVLYGSTFHASGLAFTSYVDLTSGNLKSQIDAVSGWNKQYTDLQIIAVSGWNKSYTDTTSGNLNSQINAVSGYFESKQVNLQAGSGLMLVGNTLHTSGTAYFNKIGVNTQVPTATVTVLCSGASETGVLIKGTTSQSSNLQEWQSSDGTKVAIIAANGSGYFGNNLTVSGDFKARTKSFLIDHPTKSGMKLQYACLEGPENGVYVRGYTNVNTINLPDYWCGLVDENSLTVNVTAVQWPQPNLYVQSCTNTTVELSSDRSIAAYYTVYGTRKDVIPLEVEYGS